MIILAADHGGFELKCQLIEHLKFRGFEFEDVGNHELDANDDYPDFAIPAIKKVLENPENARAILCCRSGTGEVIAANKFKGIRATISWTPEHAQKSREHNDTNVLALPADYISLEEAIKIVDTWLATSFSYEERHVRRLKKVAAIMESEKEEINAIVDK